MRHIYNPMRRQGINKFISGAFVYFISAVFHEYIISGALGKLHFSAFIAMFANFPASIFQEYLKKFKLVSQRSTSLNVMFWLTFCFLGQPLCIVLYFYSYYSDNPQFLN
jgi:diacylglycerol O-acyltransferase-1